MQKYPVQTRFNWNQMSDASPRIPPRKIKAIKVKNKGNSFFFTKMSYLSSWLKASYRLTELFWSYSHIISIIPPPPDQRRSRDPAVQEQRVTRQSSIRDFSNCRIISCCAGKRRCVKVQLGCRRGVLNGRAGVCWGGVFVWWIWGWWCRGEGVSLPSSTLLWFPQLGLEEWKKCRNPNVRGGVAPPGLLRETTCSHICAHCVCVRAHVRERSINVTVLLRWHTMIFILFSQNGIGSIWSKFVGFCGLDYNQQQPNK